MGKRKGVVTITPPVLNIDSVDKTKHTTLDRSENSIGMVIRDFRNELAETEGTIGVRKRLLSPKNKQGLLESLIELLSTRWNTSETTMTGEGSLSGHGQLLRSLTTLKEYNINNGTDVNVDDIFSIFQASKFIQLDDVNDDMLSSVFKGASYNELMSVFFKATMSKKYIDSVKVAPPEISSEEIFLATLTRDCPGIIITPLPYTGDNNVSAIDAEPTDPWYENRVGGLDQQPGFHIIAPHGEALANASKIIEDYKLAQGVDAGVIYLLSTIDYYRSNIKITGIAPINSPHNTIVIYYNEPNMKGYKGVIWNWGIESITTSYTNISTTTLNSSIDQQHIPLLLDIDTMSSGDILHVEGVAVYEDEFGDEHHLAPQLHLFEVPLKTVTSLTATPLTDIGETIRLAWDEPLGGGVAYYELYYGEGSYTSVDEFEEIEFLGPVNATGTEVGGLPNNVLHTFIIRTIYLSGLTSDAYIVEKPYDLMRPAAPVNLNVRPGDTDMLVRWDTPPEYDVDFVEIYYGIGSADTKFEGVIPLSGGVEIDGLTNGVEYVVSVTVTDTSANVSDAAVESCIPNGSLTIEYSTHSDRGSALFELPMLDNGIYDITVDWGDGNTSEVIEPHTYAVDGDYTIKIKGILNGLTFNGDIGVSSEIRPGILSISNWGPATLIDTPNGVFRGCTNLTSIPPNPPFVEVTSLARYFEGCVAFNQDLSDWNVSSITDMQFMFSGCSTFNQLLAWTTTSVVNMHGMFSGCTDFNQSLVWNTSSVVTMEEMFYNASKFNQDLSPWDIGFVTNMANMLIGCNTSIENYGKMLFTWSSQNLQEYVTFGISAYYDGTRIPHRAILTDNKHWTIIGDALVAAKVTEVRSIGGDDIQLMWTNATGFDDSSVVIEYGIGNFDTVYTGDIINSSCVISDLVLYQDYDIRIKVVSGPTEAIYDLVERPWGVTEIEVDSSKTSYQQYIYLNKIESGIASTIEIDWGDGTTIIVDNDPLTSVSQRHTYSYRSGMYTLSIKGRLDNPTFGMVNSWQYGGTFINVNRWDNIVRTSEIDTPILFAHLDYLRDVPKDLGPNMTSLTRFFYNCDSLDDRNISDWNVDNITDMSYMFDGSRISVDLSHWNVDNVTNMAHMFSGTGFQDDITTWNVANVTDMSHMFNGCTTFDQDLTNWNVDNVTDMSYMFKNCYALTGAGLSTWDVSNVVNMDHMFSSCTKLECDISNWFTAKVVNMDYMFYRNYRFNSDISTWNVDNVTTMSYMFTDVYSFDQDLTNWNVDNVTDMSYMFDGCTLFKGVGLDSWNTAKVTTMAAMFRNCASLVAPLTNWNVENVLSTYEMFKYCKKFVGDIGGWRLNSITELSYMFFQCSRFNSDLSSWVVSSSSTLSNMFAYCHKFNQDLSSWNLNGATSTSNMFYDCYEFNSDVSGWDMSTVTNTSSMFSGCTKFNQDLSSWTMDAATNTSSMFSGCIEFNSDLSSLNMSNVSNMDNMFSGCAKFEGIGLDLWTTPLLTSTKNVFNGCTIFNQDISGWDMSGVSAVDGMFNGCTIFNQDLSTWELNSLTSMSYVFKDCIEFNQDISAWDTINVTNMYGAYSGCVKFNRDVSALRIGNVVNMCAMFRDCIIFDQDLSTWDTRNVTNMEYMFENCIAFNRDLSTFDTSRVTTMKAMFNGCTIFNQDISGWDTRDVRDVNRMFGNCIAFNQPMNNFDTNSITTMSEMFDGCTIFNQDISGWDVSNVTNMTRMFKNCIAFNNNLNSWVTTKLQQMYNMFDGCVKYNQPMNNWDMREVRYADNFLLGCDDFNGSLAGWDLAYMYSPQQMFSDYTPPNFDQDISGWKMPRLQHTSNVDTLVKSLAKTMSTVNMSKLIGALPTTSSMFSGISSYGWDVPVKELITTPEMLALYDAANWVLYVPVAHEPQHVDSYAATIYVDSASGTYQLPITPDSNNTEYTVSWGDGTTSVFTSDSNRPSHVYPSVGSYFLVITGTGSNIRLNSSYSHLVEIHQLGNVFTDPQFSSFSLPHLRSFDPAIYAILPAGITGDNMFYGCAMFDQDVSGLDSFVDLSSCHSMFYNCEEFTGKGMENWDMSLATNCTNMFNGCHKLDVDLSSWVLSSLAHGSSMFSGCYLFDTDTSNWGLSTSLIAMSSMFMYCTKFKGFGVENWNVINSTTMGNLFYGCYEFNGDVSGWTLSTTSSISLVSMFRDCYEFNRDISDWHFNKVTNAADMLYNCKKFNQPVGKWNIESLSSASYMFAYCYEFNQDLTNWDVSSITSITGMFQYCQAFDGDLTGWDMSTITNISSMFRNCRSFTGKGISLWNVDNVTEMNYTFTTCPIMNIDFSLWNVDNVTGMSCTFQNCSEFEGNGLESWNIEKVTNFTYAFSDCSKLTCDLSSWNPLAAVEMYHMFSECTLFDCDLSSWNPPLLLNGDYLFRSCTYFACNLSTWRSDASYTNAWQSTPMVSKIEIQPRA